jgi:hypothetical protein
VRQQLHTFEELLQDNNCPTQLEELVAGDPVHIAGCDASKAGMGGVLFPVSRPPLLWLEPFAEDIQDGVVSQVNRQGHITNSDLKLKGTIMHHAVLANNASMGPETAHTLYTIHRLLHGVHNHNQEDSIPLTISGAASKGADL